MFFFSAIFIAFLIYLRPQEWRDWIVRFHPVHLAVLCGIVGFMRERSGTFKLKDLVRAPHDWLLLTFYAWVIYADPAPFSQTVETMKIMILFYYIISLSLSSLDRLEKFLKAWAWLIFAVAFLAVVSLVGFDPLYSSDITNGVMQGRLVLRLSIFNNPNALGHSVIPLLPVAYYLWWWRRGGRSRAVFGLMAAIGLTCVYMTQSRGSFLAGVILVSLSYIFARPKGVQVFLIVVAVSAGPAVLGHLPRMGNAQEISTEAGVVGRLVAFEWGLRKFHESPYGVGYGQFVMKFLDDNKFLKDAHSSYVLIGTELGFKGLFLFVGLIYACVRMVLMVRCETDQQERIRRAMFVFIIGYAFSSWMINIAYNPIFILILASSAAYYRIMRSLYEDTSERREEANRPKLVPGEPLAHPPAQPALAMQGVMPGGLPVATGALGQSAYAMSVPGSAAMLPPAGVGMQMPVERAVGTQARRSAGLLKDKVQNVYGINWKRVGIIDLVVIYLATYMVVRTWTYVVAQYYAR